MDHVTAVRMHELLDHGRGERPISCRICRSQIADDEHTGLATEVATEPDTVVLQAPSIIRERRVLEPEVE